MCFRTHYTYTNPFIHLLGFLLIQLMIVRINRREEPKQDLQVRLGKAMLRLGGEICLGGPERAKIRASGSPRCSDLHLGRAPRLGVHSYA